ncbi:MAG: branched-chain amino acid transaminase [Candidatus Micrarchaeota archaeon]|nr:branched-chain amino acid transaminase [Candidatus Micrarchaeota archaeon]
MPIQRTEKVWKNGKIIPWADASVDIMTHALHYGTGVFEGIRCYNTPKGPALFRAADHYKRFMESAKTYLMKIPYTQAQFVEATKQVVKANKLSDCYIRPIAFYGFGELAPNVLNCPVEVAIIAIKFGSYMAGAKERGIKCVVSSWTRISPAMIPTRAKACGQYLNSILAVTEAKARGADEAIMLNAAGFVAEASAENIFIAKDGVLVTPPLSAGILAGITRDSVIAVARDLNIPVEERNITREELYSADEVFLCGTAGEIIPVREVDGRAVGAAPGPLSRQLSKKFFEIVQGKDKKYFKWLDFVR